MKKRKLLIVWSCSDRVHHEHKTWWGAWLCGLWQRLKKTRSESQCPHGYLYNQACKYCGRGYYKMPPLDYEKAHMILDDVWFIPFKANDHETDGD